MSVCIPLLCISMWVRVCLSVFLYVHLRNVFIYVVIPVFWGVCSVSSVTRSCPTLCDPMDCSPPGTSVSGIFQARILEWLPISSPGDPYSSVFLCMPVSIYFFVHLYMCVSVYMCISKRVYMCELPLCVCNVYVYLCVCMCFQSLCEKWCGMI